MPGPLDGVGLIGQTDAMDELARLASTGRGICICGIIIIG
jgi:hypothetical protein